MQYTFLKKRAGWTGGFTLIELMIVVTVIAILAAVALPSYNNYVIKSHRTAVQQFLLNIASREEQYFLDARQYTTTIGSGGLNLTTPSEVTGYYNVSVTLAAGPPPGYTISAAPVTTSIQANDGTLTFDNTGAKTPLAKWTSQSQ
jgi:type IV pilus assembly protein PilE